MTSTSKTEAKSNTEMKAKWQKPKLVEFGGDLTNVCADSGAASDNAIGSRVSS